MLQVRTNAVGESPLFYWDLSLTMKMVMPIKLKRDELQRHLEQLAGSVAAAAGVEIFEVELKGSGPARLLRITIDKPEGVTLDDCAAVSREMEAVLDAEDPIQTPYELQVSSPGIERELRKFKDWERFQGKKAKVVLKQPAEGDLKTFDGTIARAASDETGAQSVTVELTTGRQVTFPLEQVERANLKFEW
jgi:ribosome maturation factor RimP